MNNLLFFNLVFELFCEWCYGEEFVYYGDFVVEVDGEEVDDEV